MKSVEVRYLNMFLIIITELAVIMAVKALWEYHFIAISVKPNQVWNQIKGAVGLDLGRTIQYIFFSTVIWSASNFGDFRRKTAEALLKTALAEKDNTELKFQFAEAQNAFLKQQINPHLLFNTLNAIYSAVYINSPDDSKVVLLLSEIMHYSYEDPDPQGRVALKNEIQQLKNLIELNTFRFQDTVRLDLNITGEAGEFSIIPLVLITLTENMFKHGDLRVPPHSLELTISPNGQLRYISKNVPRPQGKYNENTPVGLSNTRLRLDYAYPDNYELQIKETDALFLLELNINLAYERSHH